MKCPQILITCIFFFGAGCLSFLIHILRNRESFSLKEMLKHCIPYNIFRSKSVHMDVKMYIIHAATDSIFYFPGLAVMAIVSSVVDTSLLGLAPDHAATQPSYWTAFLSVMAILFAIELSDYIVHYAEHKIPILWELHKVHHSADIVNPLTARRGHSIALVYSGICSGIIVGATVGLLMFLFGISLIEAIALQAFTNKIGNLWTLSPLKHSHIPVGFGWFDKIFISPHMHQVHHSKLQQHWDKNFGNNLSIFDWLFNTGYKPVRGEEITFGISGYSEAELQKFNTLFGAFISPLLRINDRVWQRIGAGRRAAPGKSRNNDGEFNSVMDTGAKQMPTAPM